MSNKNLTVKLGFWAIWALGVGSVVGDGIFLLIGEGAQAAGPGSIISYLVAGILLSIVMLSICELAVGMPSSGAFSVWNERLIGSWAGAVAGFSFTAMNVVFLSSVTIAIGAISNYFFQWTESATLSAAIWGLIWVSTVFAFTLYGTGFSLRIQLYLVALLVAIMLLFAIFGVFSGHVDSKNFTPVLPFGMNGFWIAVGLGAYAYIGPLTLLTAGDEVKDVTILPKAMIWACITFLVLYTSSMIVMIGLVNYSSYASLESPYTVAAQYAFGGAAGLIMNFGAWLAAYTCLVGEAYAVSRLLYGMANHNMAPKGFKALSSRGVPFRGVFFSWILTFVLVIIGSVGTMETFYVGLATVATELGIVTWVLCLVCVILYRKKFHSEWEQLPWKLPARGIMIPLAFVGCGIVFYSLVTASPISLLFLVLVLVTFIVYYLFGINQPNT